MRIIVLRPLPLILLVCLPLSAAAGRLPSAAAATFAARNDDEFARWRDQAHDRRYRPPRRERLFDLEFLLE